MLSNTSNRAQRRRSCHFCWPSFGSGLRHPDLALAPHIALGTSSLPREEKTDAYKPVLFLGLPLASPVARTSYLSEALHSEEGLGDCLTLERVKSHDQQVRSLERHCPRRWLAGGTSYSLT